MSTSIDAVPAIVGEGNKPDARLKVDIGEIRLQNDNVEKKKKKPRRPKKKATGFEGQSVPSPSRGL